MTNFDRAYDHVWEQFNVITPFSKAEFNMVARLSIPYRLKKGELVHKQGNIPTYGGFLFRGCMRHYFTAIPDQEETTVGFEFEDSLFGDLRSIFYHDPAITSLQALEDTVIGRLNKDHYLYLFDNCKPFSKLMFLIMERRYNQLISDGIKRRNEQAEERYRMMLEEYPGILQRVPQHYIASYLGIKPQSLSRIRKNMMLQERSVNRAA